MLRRGSGKTLKEIQYELIHLRMQRAVALLQSNRGPLERSARLLLQRETMSERELQNLRPALRAAA